MADRLRILVDETLETIKQTFDDRVVSKAQVAYWYIICANQLLGKHISKKDSGAFLSVFADVPVVNVANNSKNFVKARKFLMLPSEIFDFDKDNGVEYMTYTSPGGMGCPPKFEEVKFHRTTPAEAEWLVMNPHTRPSPNNPYWYRVGPNLYLLGVEKVPISTVEMGIYMTVDPVEKIDIDMPFPFPQELISVLKMNVLDMAKYDFFYPSERQNSGSDDSSEKPLQIPKTQSVNQTPETQQ